MDKLVSVIIPSYGGGEFIEDTVDSVLDQTYKNIEVIVADDNGIGTEDQIKTAGHMAKYKDDSRVKYVCHEVNINGSAARNTGFKNSKGEYIALLDDDDTYYPDNISELVSTLDSLGDDYALVYCGVDLYRNNKMIRQVRASFSGNCLYELLSHKFAIGSSLLLMRRAVWEELGGFDESFRRHQDWEFTARIAAKYKVQAVDHIGVRHNYEFRNSAKNPAQVKEYREHYLNKMMPYIKTLTPEQQKDVLIGNRVDVAIQYIKAKDYKGFVKEYMNARPGIRGLKILYKRALRQIRD